LQVVDFDRVVLTNVTIRGYWQSDIGQFKVETTAAAVRKIDPTISVECFPDRFRPRMVAGDKVLCCVDSIETRAAIWRSVEDRCQFWADGRMLGEVIRMLVASDAGSRSKYGRSLFPAAEAQRGSCAARSTIYAASIAAGLLVHQLCCWLRRMPIDRDTSINLLAGELSLV
jgi:sulfur carrier protein ThiS adenylyltransferase